MYPFACMLFSVFLCAGPTGQPPAGQAPLPNPPSATSPGSGQPNPSAQMDCSQLMPAEKQFAEQMTSVENQRMFCQELTPAARKEVMGMTRPLRPSDPKLTPDQAMQLYQTKKAPPAKPTPTPGEKKSMAMSCSVEVISTASIKYFLCWTKNWLEFTVTS